MCFNYRTKSFVNGAQTEWARACDDGPHWAQRLIAWSRRVGGCMGWIAESRQSSKSLAGRVGAGLSRDQCAKRWPQTGHPGATVE